MLNSIQFLNYRKHKDYTCSASYLRKGDGILEFMDNFHRDNSVLNNNVNRALPSNAYQFYPKETIENANLYDLDYQINFWAVLGESKKTTLGFTNLKERKNVIYYTREMEIGEFYLFNSRKVHHARIAVAEDDDAPFRLDGTSIEMRCTFRLK